MTVDQDMIGRWCVVLLPSLALACTDPVRPSRELRRLEVRPPTTTLTALGDTLRLVAMGFDDRDIWVPTGEVDWSSSAPPIASVDDSGLAIAHANGTVTITARAGGVEGTAELLVEQSPHAIRFLEEPTDVTSGSLMDPGPSVEILDARGSRVLHSTDTVSLALSADPSDGRATLFGGSVAAVEGVAHYDSLSIDTAEQGYALEARLGVSTAASDSFDVTSSYVDLLTHPDGVRLDTSSSCYACVEALPDMGPYTFYGENYTTPFLVATHGYLQAGTPLQSAVLSLVNTVLPSEDAPPGLIGPYWDWVYGGVGDVLYAPHSDPDFSGVRVQWRRVNLRDAKLSEVDFEVLVRWRRSGCEDPATPDCSEIQFSYGDFTLGDQGPGWGATVGVQDVTGTRGYMVSRNVRHSVWEGLTITLAWTGTEYTRVR